jgi:two-component system cell cycle sensor histidine kinase/response regulator CckA
MEHLRRRVAELERANAVLEAREGRYRDLIENAKDLVWTLDLDGSVTFLNSAWEKLTGYTKQELVGKELAELVGAQNLEAARGALMRKWETDRSTHFEIRILAKDGAPIELEVNSAILERDGKRAGFLAIARDITDRKQAQAAVRRSAQEFEYLFVNHPQPMWVFDERTLRFLEVNQAALAKYGYSREEFLAMSMADLRPREDLPRFMTDLGERLDRESGNAGYWRHYLKDGRIIDVEVLWHTVVFAGRNAILSVLQDVTERRMLEEQLQQSHKLEAVGRLAGGVAHDFNNLLTVIAGYSQLLLNRIEVEHPMHAGLDQIRQSADKAAVLTRQLLAFSRRQALQPAVIDLNAIIADMEKMLRRLIGEHIELVTRLHPGLGPVRADPSQVEEVIMNLALNARDAMPQGGTVSIETSEIEFTVQGAAGHPAGFYALISVADTGEGIDSETRSHLFEPFFTTKGQRERAGLGLSAVYGIVEQHGGFIRVSSAPGEGSRFDICLPRLSSVPDPAEVSGAEATGLGGSETILVVEDEDGVLKLISETLRVHGYTVIEAGNSVEALEMAKRQDLRVDLLLTDIVMPRMTGRGLADAWKILRPDVKVLYMSGYAKGTDADELFSGLGHRLLQKPFSAVRLAQKVREALDDE